MYLKHKYFAAFSVEPLPEKGSYTTPSGCVTSLIRYCINFVGFTVVRPARRSGNLALDTYQVIKKMLPVLPLDATTIELYLAVAGLEKGLGLPGWEENINMVAPLVPTGEKERFATAYALIAGLPPPVGAEEVQGEREDDRLVRPQGAARGTVHD